MTKDWVAFEARVDGEVARMKARTGWGKHIRAALAVIVACFVAAAALGSSDPAWLNFLLTVAVVYLVVAVIGWLARRSGLRAGR